MTRTNSARHARPLIKPHPRPASTHAALALSRIWSDPEQAGLRQDPFSLLGRIGGGIPSLAPPCPADQVGPRWTPLPDGFAKLQRAVVLASFPDDAHLHSSGLFRTAVAQSKSALPQRRVGAFIFRDHSVLVATLSHVGCYGRRRSIAAPGILVEAVFQPRVLHLSRRAPLGPEETTETRSLRQRTIQLTSKIPGSDDLNLELGFSNPAEGPDVVVSARGVPSTRSTSPEFGKRLLVQLQAEIHAAWTEGCHLPTPRFPARGERPGGSWPTFLAWQTWSASDREIIESRLTSVAAIMAHRARQIGLDGSNLHIRLHAGMPEALGGARAHLEPWLPGQPDDARAALTERAEQLFFSGDWKRERFVGFCHDWITPSGSRTRGAVAPAPARFCSRGSPDIPTAHSALVIAARLAREGCPLPPADAATVGGRHSAT